MKHLSLIFLSMVLLLISCKREEIRIACVGDSITEGAGTKNQSTSSYPVVLDQLLGKGYNVLNCGRSAATMLKKSDFSFWETNQLYNLFVFKPDIITIALGTNDSKDHNWDAANFENDYIALIDSLKTLLPQSTIFISNPPPAFDHSWGINDSTICFQILPIIQRISKQENVKIIDFYTPMKDQIQLFPDKIHPNEEGATLMAEIIKKSINN